MMDKLLVISLRVGHCWIMPGVEKHREQVAGFSSELKFNVTSNVLRGDVLNLFITPSYVYVYTKVSLAVFNGLLPGKCR